MFNRCKHDWKLLSAELIPSRIEGLADRGIPTKTLREEFVDIMTARTHITVCTCTECGKLKYFTEKV